MSRDRTQQVQSLIEHAARALAQVNPKLLDDAAVLVAGAPDIAAAVAERAERDETFAEILDEITGN